MAKVDFYVLPDAGEISRQRFACRLAEKAYRLKNSVHIRVTDSSALQQLDDLLWTFRDGSFVPHEILGSSSGKPEAPVTIGGDSMHGVDADLLINLGEDIPEHIDSFPRIAEVVTSDEDSRNRSRQRFVDYRDRGHTLDTHKL